jgi:hypothetical protein
VRHETCESHHVIPLTVNDFSLLAEGRHTCWEYLSTSVHSAFRQQAHTVVESNFSGHRNSMRNGVQVLVLAWIVCCHGMPDLVAAALETTENSTDPKWENGIVSRVMHYCQGWMFGARREAMTVEIHHGLSSESLWEVRLSQLRGSRAASDRVPQPPLVAARRILASVPAPPVRAPTDPPSPLGQPGCSQKPAKFACPASTACPGKNLMHRDNGQECQAACVVQCNVVSKKKAGWECGSC